MGPGYPQRPSEQRFGERLVVGDRGRAVAERLQRDVVGARVEVGANGLGDALGRPVRDDRVDQPVAAAVGGVATGEAEAQLVV
jgi:hypothetical protein